MLLGVGPPTSRHKSKTIEKAIARPFAHEPSLQLCVEHMCQHGSTHLDFWLGRLRRSRTQPHKFTCARCQLNSRRASSHDYYPLLSIYSHNYEDYYPRRLCMAVRGCARQFLLETYVCFLKHIHVLLERIHVVLGHMHVSLTCQHRLRGAHVYVLKGVRSLGSFDPKALLINRRIMYFGGASFTDKARRDNRETTFRATGHVVEEILEDASDWRAAGTMWDGRC